MSMSYQEIPANARPVTGRHAAHAFAKRPPAARALAAADWYAGRTSLTKPTRVLAASAYSTTVHEARLAGQIGGHADLRAAVMDGVMSLPAAARCAAARASFLAAGASDEALAACDSDEVQTQPVPPTVVEQVPVVVDHTAAPAPTLPAAPTTAVATETASDAELAAVAPRLSRFWRVVEHIANPF
jgi:hypothetical protein